MINPSIGTRLTCATIACVFASSLSASADVLEGAINLSSRVFPDPHQFSSATMSGGAGVISDSLSSTNDAGFASASYTIDNSETSPGSGMRTLEIRHASMADPTSVNNENHLESSLIDTVWREDRIRINHDPGVGVSLNGTAGTVVLKFQLTAHGQGQVIDQDENINSGGLASYRALITMAFHGASESLGNHVLGTADESPEPFGSPSFNNNLNSVLNSSPRSFTFDNEGVFQLQMASSAEGQDVANITGVSASGEASIRWVGADVFDGNGVLVDPATYSFVRVDEFGNEDGFMDTLDFIIPGDLDGDGFVGINDLNIVLSNWNQNVPPGDPLADPSGDGFVGIDDLNTVLGNWNAGTPPGESAATIPEPGIAMLVLSGAAGALSRR